MKATICGLLCLFCLPALAGRERIYQDAKFNGKSVRMVVDTGMEFQIVIISTAAKKLGVQYTPPDFNPPSGKVAFGLSELCSLNLEGKELFDAFPVMEVPFAAEIEEAGVLGWAGIKPSVFSIDAVADQIHRNVALPADIGQWLKFDLDTNTVVMAFDVPMADGSIGVVFVDTGTYDGVALSPSLWRDWKSSHPHQPMTCDKYFAPAYGYVIQDESWADGIALGKLEITSVAVKESESDGTRRGLSPDSKYLATLGLAALKRLDIIVDGRRNMVYLRPKTTTPMPFLHNRLGADFAPRSKDQDALSAKVMNGSAAEAAGVHNGDILLKLDDKDATHWRTDTNRPPDVLPVQQPAGTKLKLTLKRGEKVFETTAVLRNILPPDGQTNAPPKR